MEAAFNLRPDWRLTRSSSGWLVAAALAAAAAAVVVVVLKAFVAEER